MRIKITAPEAILSGQLLAMALAACAATTVNAELNYTCDNLSGMAARFQALKTAGHDLDDVMAVIQKASAGNPEKEALLSNLAIEIYIDPDITDEDEARASATRNCTR